MKDVPRRSHSCRRLERLEFEVPICRVTECEGMLLLLQNFRETFGAPRVLRRRVQRSSSARMPSCALAVESRPYECFGSRTESRSKCFKPRVERDTSVHQPCYESANATSGLLTSQAEVGTATVRFCSNCCPSAFVVSLLAAVIAGTGVRCRCGITFRFCLCVPPSWLSVSALLKRFYRVKLQNRVVQPFRLGAPSPRAERRVARREKKGRRRFKALL